MYRVNKLSLVIEHVLLLQYFVPVPALRCKLKTIATDARLHFRDTYPNCVSNARRLGSVRRDGMHGNDIIKTD